MSRIDPSPSVAIIPPDKRQDLIGKTARITFGALTFEVTVKAHKVAYGTDRWLVTPVTGSGETWVQNIEPKRPL